MSILAPAPSRQQYLSSVSPSLAVYTVSLLTKTTLSQFSLSILLCLCVCVCVSLSVCLSLSLSLSRLPL